MATSAIPQTSARRARSRLPLLGVGVSLLAALCYASSHVLSRQVVTTLAPPLITSFYAGLFGTLLMALFVGASRSRASGTARRGVVFMALSGMAASGGIAFLYFALSRAPVAVVSPIVGINPLLVVLLAHFFLQRLERVTVRIWLGTLLVVSGVALITLSNA